MIPEQNYSSSGCLVELPALSTDTERELAHQLQAIRAQIDRLQSTERELRQTIASAQARYNHTPALLYSTDATGTLISVNEYWLHSLGYTWDEVIGRPIGDFVTPEFAHYVRKVILPEFLVSGAAQDIHCQLVKKNGAVLDVLLTAAAERDADGKIEQIHTSSIDSAQWRKAESDFLTSEEHFRALFETSPLAMVTGDEDRTHPFVEFNLAFQELLGYSAAELKRMSVKDITHPDDVESSLSQHLDLAVSNQDFHRLENRYIRKDGSVIWCNTTISNMRDADGQYQFTVATLEDITERKAAFELLEARVQTRTHEIERRRGVAESLRDLLTVLNLDWSLPDILTYLTGEAAQLMGSDNSVLYRLRPDGENSNQVQHGSYAAQGKPMLPPALQHSVDYQPIAIYGTGFAGDEACISFLSVPLRLANEFESCLALFYSDERLFSDEDISLMVMFSEQAALAVENARLRQQIERTAIIEERNRLARELHDSVTQSLYSLTLLAEGWRRHTHAWNARQVDSMLLELGQIAQQALKEMRLLVYELRPPTLTSEGLIGALQHRLSVVEKRAGIETRLTTNDTLSLPAAMEQELYRIALEGLNNALKHAQATRVSVDVQEESNGISLHIQDNGCGFDMQALAENVGIGLESMRERVERLRGNLTIDSVVGSGTTISVRVPLSE